jgi:hypothetical protein
LNACSRGKLLLESFSAGYVSSTCKDGVAFLVMIGILMFLPAHLIDRPIMKLKGYYLSVRRAIAWPIAFAHRPDIRCNPVLARDSMAVLLVEQNAMAALVI